MNRRELFKALLPVAIAPAIALSVVSEQEPTKYRGWQIRWSGWIPSQNQHIYVGHWYAKNPKRGFDVCSAYPGKTGKFYADMIMDTSIQNDQGIPNLESTKEELDSYKADALHRLTKFMDEYWSDF